MYVWLVANYCSPVDNNYQIGIVEVENNKLRFKPIQIQKTAKKVAFLRITSKLAVICVI